MSAPKMEGVLKQMEHLSATVTQAGLEMAFFVKTWTSVKSKVTIVAFTQNASICQVNINASAKSGGQVMATTVQMSTNVNLLNTHVAQMKTA